MSHANLQRRPAAPHARALRAVTLLGIATLAASLSSCGGGDHHGCINCNGYPPYEVSYGLVAGDFNRSGLPSIVATARSTTGCSNLSGYLKSYLATTAGTYPGAVTTSDGTTRCTWRAPI